LPWPVKFISLTHVKQNVHKNSRLQKYSHIVFKNIKKHYG
jgi:hypothetical protein